MRMITKQNIKQLYIPDHPYRILIIGDYGYGNTTALLNLINNQPGRKRKAPEIRSALFFWLVDVREALIGRFPKHLFKLKAKELYAEWLIDNPTEPKMMYH